MTEFPDEFVDLSENGYQDLTNAELMELLAARREELQAIKDKPGEPIGHDLYRALLFQFCLDCGVRLVDTWTHCDTCKPIRVFICDPYYQDLYPMKSGKRMISPLEMVAQKT